MKLHQVSIHNYRSIKDLTLTIPDMLILIGPNNHGKSNILRAIEFALSPSAKPDPEDFFAYRPSDDKELWVEVIFRDLTPNEKNIFEKYLLDGEKIRIRKSAQLLDDGVIKIAYRGYVKDPQEWWLKRSAWDRLSTRENIQNEAENIPQLRDLLRDPGRITQQTLFQFQQRYINEHRHELEFEEILEDAPLLGRTTLGAGVLPDFFLIPALQDVSEETKVKGTTVFGRLFQRAVQEMAEADERFRQARERVRELINDLNTRPEHPETEGSALTRLEAMLTEELKTWGVKTAIEVTPPDLEKIFELGTQLRVDDGLKTLAEKKGNGLQRAILFALVRVWGQSLRLSAQITESTPRPYSDSVFFAVEEPELFLHPHAQRQLLQALGSLVVIEHHQVFLTTHSTHFVNLDRYERLAIVTKPSPSEGTQVRQCSDELFTGEDIAERKRRFHMASWVNPERAELFFAHKVILVEGETEKAVLPFLAHNLNCFDPNVTVIDCGSKFNIPLYMRILNAFRIPYCVIHDEDPVPDPIPPDWDEDKRKAADRTFSMNKEIKDLLDSNLGEVEILNPDFEGVANIPKNQARKKGKALAALDYLSKEEIPERLTEVIRKAFKLRSFGGDSNG